MTRRFFIAAALVGVAVSVSAFRGPSPYQDRTGFAFGRNYQYAEVEARSTTSSGTFQTKTTLTTAAVPAGTYRVSWKCNWDTANGGQGEYRLRNTTDAVTVDGPMIVGQDFVAGPRFPIGGFREVVFTGAAKTFVIQFRAAPDTVGIEQARIEFWRLK